MKRRAIITFERVETHDDQGDPREYLFQDEDYREEDQKRLDAWLSGDWHFIGVRAKATIKVPHGESPESWIITSMMSPGLWGIESDSEESHLAQVYQDEKQTLIEMLESLKDAEVQTE